MRVPEVPLSRVQIDFIGPFQPSVTSQYRYVLAMQDVWTRYSLLVPTRDATADTAAKMLLERWVTVLDIPEVLQSDQGPHFTGEVFSSSCLALGIRQALSSPNHAQSNGQVERQNQLIDNVRCVCGDQPASWPDAVHAVQYAHNTATNATTGYSPYQLLFHQHPNRPEEFAVPMLAVPRTIRHMDRVFRSARERIRSAQEDRCRRSGGKIEAGYCVGDRVRIKLQPRQKQYWKKLSAHKSDVYFVVRRLRNTYTLCPGQPIKNHQKELVRHYNELEAAPSQHLRWEPDLSSEDDIDDLTDGTAGNEPSGDTPPYGRRLRKKTKFLQVDPKKQQYSLASAIDEAGSFSDSDNDDVWVLGKLCNVKVCVSTGHWCFQTIEQFSVSFIYA